MVSVRLLGEDDWAVFREIRLRSLLESPDAFGSTYGEESSHGEGPWRDWAAGRWQGASAAVFLATEIDRPVGTATGAEYEVERGAAHLFAMWVAPDARGTGIGRLLVDAVADWAGERSCERLLLNVTETNRAARSFYEACGFVDTGERRPLREGSDLRVLILAKEL